MATAFIIAFFIWYFTRPYKPRHRDRRYDYKAGIHY